MHSGEVVHRGKRSGSRLSIDEGAQPRTLRRGPFGPLFLDAGHKMERLCSRLGRRARSPRITVVARTSNLRQQGRPEGSVRSWPPRGSIPRRGSAAKGRRRRSGRDMGAGASRAPLDHHRPFSLGSPLHLPEKDGHRGELSRPQKSLGP